MKRYLDYQQTSLKTGIKVPTLYSLVFQKRIPHVRLGKRLVRFSEEELDRWLEEKSVTTREEAESAST